MTPKRREYDYVLVGGGLQAGLIALAVRHYQPQASMLLIERGEALGGNHTWSFHQQDLPQPCQAWQAVIPKTRWDAYSVRFPNFSRQVPLAYCSIRSTDFATAVTRQLLGSSAASNNLQVANTRLLFGTHVTSIDGNTVTTKCHRAFRGRTVIDCRGPQRRECDSSSDIRVSRVGYQKFSGIEIELQHDWPDRHPVLMDACVDQACGFHFIYVLPFTPRRVLVEDTYFSDTPELDFSQSQRQLRLYVQRVAGRGWHISRQEHGCLPMPYSSTSEPFPVAINPHLLSGGYAGGWFHAATGYSYALATRFADAVGRSTPDTAAQAIAELRQTHHRRAKFARQLNHLLFRLVTPASRWQIFRRLYRDLPSDCLGRFYAHEFTFQDAARMVLGMPPSGLTPLRFLKSLVRRSSERVAR